MRILRYVTACSVLYSVSLWFQSWIGPTGSGVECVDTTFLTHCFWKFFSFLFLSLFRLPHSLVGLDWIRPVWTGLDWTGHDWTWFWMRESIWYHCFFLLFFSLFFLLPLFTFHFSPHVCAWLIPALYIKFFFGCSFRGFDRFGLRWVFCPMNFMFLFPWLSCDCDYTVAFDFSPSTFSLIRVTSHPGWFCNSPWYITSRMYIVVCINA